MNDIFILTIIMILLLQSCFKYYKQQNDTLIIKSSNSACSLLQRDSSMFLILAKTEKGEAQTIQKYLYSNKNYFTYSIPMKGKILSVFAIQNEDMEILSYQNYKSMVTGIIVFLVITAGLSILITIIVQLIITRLKQKDISTYATDSKVLQSIYPQLEQINSQLLDDVTYT